MSKNIIDIVQGDKMQVEYKGRSKGSDKIVERITRTKYGVKVDLGGKYIFMTSNDYANKNSAFVDEYNNITYTLIQGNEEVKGSEDDKGGKESKGAKKEK